MFSSFLLLYNFIYNFYNSSLSFILFLFSSTQYFLVSISNLIIFLSLLLAPPVPIFAICQKNSASLLCLSLPLSAFLCHSLLPLPPATLSCLSLSFYFCLFLHCLLIQSDNLFAIRQLSTANSRLNASIRRQLPRASFHAAQTTWQTPLPCFL